MSEQPESSYYRQCNPPSAPHFGGSWERRVKSAKHALIRRLLPTDESLNSALILVENLLNGRPLTFVNVDPKDPEVLTPNHLLLGGSLQNSGPFISQDENLVSRSRWRRVQAMADHFWCRWMKEYLPTLNERKKWH